MQWSLSPTTSSLASLGFPACSAISPVTSLFALGAVSFSIAAVVAYAGVQLGAQAAVIELSGTTFGLGLSDVASLTVGAR
jgi:hypothetical protein